MLKFAVTFLVVHIMGMVVYVTVVDELYCQGDFHQRVENDCFAWKGAAGMWEFVLFQEFVVRPLIKEAR